MSQEGLDMKRVALITLVVLIGFTITTWAQPRCRSCNGTGKVMVRMCPGCHGKGQKQIYCSQCTRGRQFTNIPSREGYWFPSEPPLARGDRTIWRRCPYCNGQGLEWKQCGDCLGQGGLFSACPECYGRGFASPWR